ncbi:MAG TPA: cutinase family protein [Mycobacterium sp.]|nr:cutinase family protein [Mycobacterium sp.]
MAAAVSTALATPLAPAIAMADPCPDVQVVFARGTNEPAGTGGLGQTFVNDLRSRIGERPLAVHAVDYPASMDFPAGAQGIADVDTEVRTLAGTCPNARIVLGGYSQGAAVIGYSLTDQLPPNGAIPQNLVGPLPKNVADRIAAVAFFGKPSNEFLGSLGLPPITIDSRFADKTIDQCEPGDFICSGGGNPIAHSLYVVTGMVDQAADFAASRL